MLLASPVDVFVSCRHKSVYLFALDIYLENLGSIFYLSNTSSSHTKDSSSRRISSKGQAALEKMPQVAEAAAGMHADPNTQATLDLIPLNQEHGQPPEAGTGNKAQDDPHPKDNTDLSAKELGIEGDEQDKRLKDATSNSSGQDAVTQTDKEAADSREEQNKETAIVHQTPESNQNNLDILRAMEKFQKSINAVHKEVKAIAKAQHEARKDVSKVQTRLDAE